MYLVNIEDVRPGQVLSKAVTNERGAVLCPAGFVMTAGAIERLKNAGVDYVVLEGGPDQSASYANRLDELEKRFSGIDDPIMLQIRAAVEKRLSFHMLDGEGE